MNTSQKTVKEKLFSFFENDIRFADLVVNQDVNGILSLLNEKNIRNENHELQSVKAVALKFTDEVAAQIIGGFKAAAGLNPLLDALYYSLCSVGIDFANEKVQGYIDALQANGVWSKEIASELKEMGVWQTSMAFNSFGRDATQEDVEEALFFYARILLERKITQKYSNVLQKIGDGTIKTVEDANTEFAKEVV